MSFAGVAGVVRGLAVGLGALVKLAALAVFLCAASAVVLLALLVAAVVAA